jgi:hypothetical protein
MGLLKSIPVLAADHENLEVLNVKGLLFLGDNHVDESVCKQNNVEVSNVGFEFVVETD